METKKISDRLSVSGQLTPDQMGEAAEAGFRSVMVNRPDGEGDDQPTFAEIEAAARKVGMEARHVPVSPGQISERDVSAFDRALSEMPSPTIGFCRTGARTTKLWELAQAPSGQ